MVIKSKEYKRNKRREIVFNFKKVKKRKTI